MMGRKRRHIGAAAAIVCTVVAAAPGFARTQDRPPAAPPDTHGSSMQVTPLE